MKIPRKHVHEFARELIEECTYDRDARVTQYRTWANIFYTGSDNDTPSKHNRVFSHVDKLSSYLFSPSQVVFNIDFDDMGDDKWETMAEAGSSYLNRQFARAGSDLTFSTANEWSLVKGACIAKLTWGRAGFEPYVIQPEFFGVMRPDIESLDRQDAMTHTFFLTPTQFRRMLGDHPKRSEIMGRVQATFSAADEDLLQTTTREVVSGGGYPLTVIGVPGVQTAAQQTYGNVDWTTSQMGPMLATDVRARLIRVDDLWVWNDDQKDWTLLRVAHPDIIIEGEYIHRNLSDIPHEHPFVRVCSNEVPGYFWGRSEIANIWPNQKMLSARLNNIDSIFNQQARPARSVIGSAGITDEKARALLSPGGVLTDASPTTKIETYKPDMPQGALEYLQYLDTCFDEAAGFNAILSGQGEPGVRAGNHANTLLRTSSPRLRDRALMVERQAATWGEMHLKMLRAKDATVIRADGGVEFAMDQLPEDASVVVDSHTSSPAFSGDNEQLAFALARAGAMDPLSLIEATHPPRQDVLISRLKRKDAAHAKELEALKKQDPELWVKAAFGTGSRRK